jgi:hypothetical protein
LCQNHQHENNEPIQRRRRSENKRRSLRKSLQAPANTRMGRILFSSAHLFTSMMMFQRQKMSGFGMMKKFHRLLPFEEKKIIQLHTKKFSVQTFIIGES